MNKLLRVLLIPVALAAGLVAIMFLLLGDLQELVSRFHKRARRPEADANQ